MPTYKIGFQTGAFTQIEVEADSFEDAVDAAWNEGFPSICARCSGWGQDTNLELGDEWEPDETFYYVDGEYVEAPKPEATS